MLFSFLSKFSLALKPVILVPGTCGTMMKGTVTRKDFWYCPKMKDTTIYINNKYIMPPLYNCMFSALEQQFDQETKYYKNADGVELHAFDWGGIEAFRFVDIIPSHPAFAYFGDFIQYLQKYGYALKETIFGAPFDWRYGPQIQASFWANLSQLIEHASQINQNSRVVLVGHSLGGYMIQRFLTKHTTAEWRNQYIDSAVLSAPSFGGSGLAFTSIVTGHVPLISGIMSERVAKSVRSIGALHAQMPNHEIFGNQPLGIDKDGNSFTAADFPAIIEKYGYVDKDLFSIAKDEPALAPEQPDVPVAIVYNTGIETVKGYDFQKENCTYGRGDIVINAEGLEYVCKNWKQNPNGSRAKIVCIDIKKADLAYNHIWITTMADAVKTTMDFVVDDSWEN